jgi:hypothetical protein
MNAETRDSTLKRRLGTDWCVRVSRPVENSPPQPPGCACRRQSDWHAGLAPDHHLPAPSHGHLHGDQRVGRHLLTPCQPLGRAGRRRGFLARLPRRPGRLRQGLGGGAVAGGPGLAGLPRLIVTRPSVPCRMVFPTADRLGDAGPPEAIFRRAPVRGAVPSQRTNKLERMGPDSASPHVDGVRVSAQAKDPGVKKEAHD